MLSFGVIWLFGAGGEGSLLPVIVFGSWAVPITRLIWPTGGGAIIILILYYIFLLSLNTISCRLTRCRLAALTVHYLGVAVAFFTRGREEASLFLPFWLIFFISSIIVFLYLWTDWGLARADSYRGRRLPPR
jgi:hypothetical protein